MISCGMHNIPEGLYGGLSARGWCICLDIVYPFSSLALHTPPRQVAGEKTCNLAGRYAVVAKGCVMQLIGYILFGCIWVFILIVGLFMLFTTREEWSKTRIERRKTQPLKNEEA